MELLDDDVLFCILFHWRWVEMGAGGGQVDRLVMCYVAQVSLVSRRWCRLAKERFIPLVGEYTDAATGHQAITDAACAMLYNLDSLSLVKNAQVTTVGLACCTRLRSLSLGSSTVIDYATVLSALTSLEILCLHDGCTLDDATVARMTWLQRLDMEGVVAVTETGVTALTQLTYLSLRDANTITADALTALTRLITLDIDNNTHIDLNSLQCIPSLRGLVAPCLPTLFDAHLRALTQLEYLDIGWNAQIDLSLCRDMPFLKELTLALDPRYDFINHGVIEELRARGVCVALDDSEWLEPDPEPVVAQAQGPCTIQ